MSEAILLLSGGIDSTTLLWELTEAGERVTCLTFDYGQRLSEEIEVACRNAAERGADFRLVEAPLGWLAPACTLLDDNLPLAQGRDRMEIEAAGTPASYVPFRNGILFAYAVAYGEAHGIEDIYGGCNGLLSGNYWDDTDAFACAFTAAAALGTDPAYQPRILAPYARLPKDIIVARGLSVGLDYRLTLSCYAGPDEKPAGARHCGRCDSCIQREEALVANHLNLEGAPLG